MVLEHWNIRTTDAIMVDIARPVRWSPVSPDVDIKAMAMAVYFMLACSHKPWENHRKTMGRPDENHKKTMGKWMFTLWYLNIAIERSVIAATAEKNSLNFDWAMFNGNVKLLKGNIQSSMIFPRPSIDSRERLQETRWSLRPNHPKSRLDPNVEKKYPLVISQAIEHGHRNKRSIYWFTHQKIVICHGC